MSVSPKNEYSSLNLIESKDEKRFSFVLGLSLFVIPLVTALLVYLFFTYGSVAPNQIGQIGDFFGGWLTPLIGGFIALLLVFTIRFLIQELRLTRLAVEKSASVQNKVAETQEKLLTRSFINFEMESSAKGLISLVKQTDNILNTKVNVYVDILNFDNKLPHETRLFNVIDSWNFDIDNGKSFDIKFRHGRDSKVIAKYLHNIHHELYVCQTLVKNEGWVYISPHVKSIAEHIEAIVTLNAVKLVSDNEMWLVKQAVQSLYDKLSNVKLDGVILGSEIIAKLIMDKIKVLIETLPTPEAFATIDKATQDANAEQDENNLF